jgi:pheromone shutdown protein TraB
MVENILKLSGTIVVVTGRGHVQGIKELLHQHKL